MATFLLIDNFDPKICKYSYPKLLLLLTNWTGFTITLGASSLLAQQKLIDYYNKLEEKENNSEQEKKVEYIELKEDVNNNIINDEDAEYIQEEINDKSQKEIIKEKIELDEKEERKKKFTSLALFSLANFFLTFMVFVKFFLWKYFSCKMASISKSFLKVIIYF